MRFAIIIAGKSDFAISGVHRLPEILRQHGPRPQRSVLCRRHLLPKKDYNDAIRTSMRCWNTIAKTTKTADAHYLKGMCLLGLGSNDAAAREFRDVYTRYVGYRSRYRREGQSPRSRNGPHGRSHLQTPLRLELSIVRQSQNPNWSALQPTQSLIPATRPCAMLFPPLRSCRIQPRYLASASRWAFQTRKSCWNMRGASERRRIVFRISPGLSARARARRRRHSQLSRRASRVQHSGHLPAPSESRKIQRQRRRTDADSGRRARRRRRGGGCRNRKRRECHPRVWKRCAARAS